MADIGFDGSTVTFDGDKLGALADFDYQNNAAEIDDSGSLDDDITVIMGWDDEVSTITVLGSTLAGHDVGDKGAVAVDLNDGGTDGSITNGLIVGLTVSGSLGQAITSKIEMVEGSPAA